MTKEQRAAAESQRKKDLNRLRFALELNNMQRCFQMVAHRVALDVSGVYKSYFSS